jgi:hypothetical protein
MRTLILIAGLVAGSFIACGGDSDSASDSDTSVPIMHVNTFIRSESTPGQFEPRGVVVPDEGAHECLIPATGDKYVIGTCEWQVEEGMGSWGVTYIETWRCEDLRAAVGDTIFCPDETGRHEWHYGVTPDGTVQLLVESGNAPPESAGAGAPSQ